MIVEKDPYIANVAKILYRASEDERIHGLCKERERRADNKNITA